MSVLGCNNPFLSWAWTISVSDSLFLIWSVLYWTVFGLCVILILGSNSDLVSDLYSTDFGFCDFNHWGLILVSVISIIGVTYLFLSWSWTLQSSVLGSSDPIVYSVLGPNNDWFWLSVSYLQYQYQILSWAWIISHSDLFCTVLYFVWFLWDDNPQVQ